MSLYLFIPALLLGIVSSFHCIGMCGPITLILPVQHLGASGRFGAMMIYHTGRIATYTILGLVLGLAGGRVWLAGFAQPFSISLGFLIIAILVTTWINQSLLHRQPSGRFFSWVRKVIVQQSATGGRMALLVTGMANGLLPCGMVYFALIAALASGSVSAACLFMFGFGLGTLPLMLALNQLRSVPGMRVRVAVRRVTPVFVALVGCLLILRGMNLNIPFISPFFTRIPSAAVSCHP